MLTDAAHRPSSRWKMLPSSRPRRFLDISFPLALGSLDPALDDAFFGFDFFDDLFKSVPLSVQSEGGFPPACGAPGIGRNPCKTVCWRGTRWAKPRRGARSGRILGTSCCRRMPDRTGARSPPASSAAPAAEADGL